MEDQRVCLLNDQLGVLVNSLLAEQAPLEERFTKVQQKLAQLLTYVINNLGRMCYGHFRQQGYRIGSGAMEAAIEPWCNRA